MKVIITVQETVTKYVEIEIPDDAENPKKYCFHLYNSDELELEVSDSTCSSFEVEIVKESRS